jgi:hypothetical protein
LSPITIAWKTAAITSADDWRRSDLRMEEQGKLKECLQEPAVCRRGKLETSKPSNFLWLYLRFIH